MKQDTHLLTVEAIGEMLLRARSAKSQAQVAAIQGSIAQMFAEEDGSMPLDDEKREKLNQIETVFVAYCQDGDIRDGAQAIYELIHG